MVRILEVSGVEPQKRKKDRYNIYIDGEYKASLGAQACIVYGIKANSKVSEETFTEAVLTDNTQYAFDSAVSLLSHKMRTRSELTNRLIDRGIDTDAVEAAMDKLESYGYVDDASYANAYIESAIAAASYGRKVVSHKLKQKGLSGDVIDEALEAYSDDIERDIVSAQLMTLRKRYAGEDEMKRKRKIFAALQRKGFDYDIINTILAEEENIEI